MAGRPPKLTPERQARACQAVQLGATYEMAAQYAGVTYACWRKWIEKANQGRQPYIAFLDALKDAEAKAVLGWLAKIEKAASDGEWTAAAWKLERRYPDVYGRRVTELRGDPSAPVVFTLKLGEREPAVLGDPLPLRALPAEAADG